MEVFIPTRKDWEEFKQEMIKEVVRTLREAPPDPLQDKKFLRTSEVKDLMNISETKLYDLRRKRIIPFKKVDGTILYPRDPLLKYLNQTSAFE